METLFFIAAVLIPFSAEWIATTMPVKDRPLAARWVLVPLMGALVYTGFLVLAGHPHLALFGSALYYYGLTAISNKKYMVLRDPFNAHDFDNARHLYIYPEFYISYVGWPFLLTLLAVLTAIILTGIQLDTTIFIYELGPWYIVWPLSIFVWFSGLWGAGKLIALLVNDTTADRFGITLNLKKDVARFGLFPTILLYRVMLRASQHKITLRSAEKTIQSKVTRPADIIALQGESFFDLGRLFDLISEGKKWDTLSELEAKGVQRGLLDVPAWGAYTMQTEFSFLSGIANATLGIDKINPYMRFAQQSVVTYVSALRQAGYRTICIHPAKKAFFRRSCVMPNLGFDEFIGLEAFEKADYFGKYISDKSLGDKIESIVSEHHATSEQPLFIFAITIESHGPWEKGRLQNHLPAGTLEELLLAKNLTGDYEFTLYQQHMENLLNLYRRLSVDTKTTTPRVVSMYGDHMPALCDLFDKYGLIEIDTNYLLWQSDGTETTSAPTRIGTEDLAPAMIKAAGLTLTS